MVLPQPDINLTAVLITTILSMIIGSLWYSPLLFGRMWMKAMKVTEKQIKDAKKKGMGGTYFAQFVATFITSYVLAHFIDYLGSTTAGAGAQTAFWLWIGFIAPVTIGAVLWENKPLKTYIISILHYLVCLLVSGAILAVWV